MGVCSGLCVWWHPQYCFVLFIMDAVLICVRGASTASRFLYSRFRHSVCPSILAICLFESLSSFLLFVRCAASILSELIALRRSLIRVVC